jgi:hypothetical protein
MLDVELVPAATDERPVALVDRLSRLRVGGSQPEAKGPPP